MPLPAVIHCVSPALSLSAGTGSVKIAEGTSASGEILSADPWVEFKLADSVGTTIKATGALDTKTGESVLAMFEAIASGGSTIVVVTHDPDVAARCLRVVRIRDGLVESDSCSSNT